MIGDILPDILAECGLDRASPDIGENIFEMRQIRSLMNVAGRDINTRVEWSRAQGSFGVTSADFGALPVDFQRMANAGAVIFDGNDHIPVRPCVSPELWQLLEKFPPEQPYYLLRDGRIYFTVDTGAEGALVRYVSANWVSGTDAVASNADVTIFPERLLAKGTVWRWKRQKGLPYDDLMAEFEADMESAARSDRGIQ